MEFKEINYFDCVFSEFGNGIVVDGNGEGFKIEEFGHELKELMKKYKIKEICPTHRENAQISRNVKENQIHLVSMHFESE